MMAVVTKTITVVDLLKDWVFTNPPTDDAFHVVISDPQSEGNPIIYDFSPDNVIRIFIERYTEWLFPYCCIQSRFTNYNDPHNTFMESWVDYKADQMPNWQRIAHAYNLQYNPIHNYDRTETETISAKKDGTNTESFDDYTVKQDLPPLVNTTHKYGNGETGNNSVDSVQNEMSVATYNNEPVQTTINKTTGTEKTENSYTENVDTVDTTYTGKRSIATDETGNTTRNLNISGNIGVTTSVQMITEELKLRKFDMLDYIIEGFAKKYLFLS